MGGAELGEGRCVARVLRPRWELLPNGSAGKGFWGGLGFSNSWEKSHEGHVRQCQDHESYPELKLPPEGGVAQNIPNSTLFPVSLVSFYSLQGWFSCGPNRLAGDAVQIAACYLLHICSSCNLPLNDPYTISQFDSTLLECFARLVGSSPRLFLIINQTVWDYVRRGLMLFGFRVIS